MTARELRPIAGLVELDHTSLRERAMQVLRTSVSAGQIPAGTRLVETELSAEMGISRGTLREALRQLAYEGLIEVGERGRLTVHTLTAVEIQEVFAVRTALEGLAAATITRRPDRNTANARLRTALDDLDGAGGPLAEMVDIDLAFHRLLCELTGNASLVRSWQALTGPIRMAITFAGPDVAVANMSAQRHRAVVDAIATGDPAVAHAAVEEHMTEAVQVLLSSAPF